LAVPDPILDKNPHSPHHKVHRMAYPSQAGNRHCSVGILRYLGFLTESVFVFHDIGANPE